MAHTRVCDEQQDGCTALEKLRGEMNTMFAELKPQMQTALEGVSNYRKATLEWDKYITESRLSRKLRAEAEERAEKKKWTRMQKITVAGIVVSIVLALGGWAFTGVYSFIKDVNQAVRELHEIHKVQAAPNQKPAVPSTSGELHVATANQPTDATIAPPYQSGVTYVY